MRRQDSCSSDMRLDPAASASAHHGDPNAKTMGCMSGIICFLSKYHRTNFRKCKFLTFGKTQNQEKNNGRVGNGSSSPGSSSTTIQAASTNRIVAQLTELNKIGDKSPSSHISYLQAVSCNIVPRSPTLPADIRRRSAPSLVIARLMGLEEEEAPSIQVQDQYYYSRITGQKRQQLLGALEKCDRDLKALKQMIEAVGAPPKKSIEAIDNTVVVINKGIKKRSNDGAILKKSSSELQPSCVSVLDDESSTRFPFSNPHHHYSKKQISFNINYGRAQQRKIAGEEDCYLSNPSSIINKFTTESSVAAFDENKTRPDYHVIVEESTVDQVCRDIAWGEKREMGRIGLALQDLIYKNLIQELVAEMDYSKYTSPVCSLPFEACKRRLSF
ncbi:uncharacterized protein LOC133722118 [Rosa rugosa]|uniref:uncharacterized protein LOC133722118 n=1 Tax=Rosa rugosa TaxID=74645 RepID=UPI002B405287|nr:uncharacterized protein LOC133722118 [Rosa rugosa]